MLFFLYSDDQKLSPFEKLKMLVNSGAAVCSAPVTTKPVMRIIDDAMSNADYENAVWLVDDQLYVYPTHPELLVKKAICTFMHNGACLAETCQSLSASKNEEAKLWGILFLACLPLLQKNKIDSKMLVEILPQTDNLAFKVFVFRFLEVHCPATKWQYEYDFKAEKTLWHLLCEYQPPRQHPIFHLEFLEEMIQRSIKYFTDH